MVVVRCSVDDDNRICEALRERRNEALTRMGDGCDDEMVDVHDDGSFRGVSCNSTWKGI